MRGVTMACLCGLLALPVQALEVTDQSGYTTDVPAHVERIVAIPIPLASMIMAIDQGPQRLVAMHQASRSDLEVGLLGRIFPAALEIPTNASGEGFVPNVEALAAADPDLVFQWGDRGEAIITPIRQLGLPVLTLRYGDSVYAEQWLLMVGQALGQAQRGEALAHWFETRRIEIEQRAGAIPQQQRPRALYLYRGRSGLQVAGQNTSMDSDIRRVGALNVAAGIPGFAPIDIEQLLVWDPQLILLNNFEPGLTPADLLNDPRLAELSAVRDKRVYLYPYGGFRWDPPSQETPLALDWLFSLAHPDQAEPGLRQRVVKAYRLLYGYEASAEDLDRVLRLEANADSALYRALFADSVAGVEP